MIIPATELPQVARTASRPIIIGSGPVGLSLARFLASKGCASLVIEGGNQTAAGLARTDLAIEATAEALPGAIEGRTRQLGGGLNLWGGQLATFHEEETTPPIGNPADWPIAVHELTTRYGAAACLLGLTQQPLQVSELHAQSDRSALSAEGLALLSTVFLKRPKLETEVWRQLHASHLITIATGAFADRIECHEGTNQVRGVRAVLADGEHAFFNGSCVVIASGTIETIRLLLLPACDGRDQPWSNLDWLGRGFNEHLDITAATIAPRNAARLMNVFDPFVAGGLKYLPKPFAQVQVSDTCRLSAVAAVTNRLGARNSLTEARQLIKAISPRAPATQLRSLFSATLASAREVGPLAWRYLRHKRLGTVLRGKGVVRISVEQPFRRESRITLSDRMKDSRGVPSPRLHWVIGEEEGRALLEISKRLKRWAEVQNVARIDIDPMLLSNPSQFVRQAEGGLHHAGGTRMANTAADGVVDTDLRVFNAERLYCCGASTFPRSGFANPTLTAVTLGIRLGEHLISKGLAKA